MLSKAKYLLILAGLAVMGACTDDDSPDEEMNLGGCKITLNGGPYANSTFTTDGTAMPVYLAEEDLNVISFYGEANGQEILVSITYPGKNAGRVSWTEETCYVTTHQVIDNKIVQGIHIREEDPLSLHSGYVEVLRYDEKAGIITGKFTGDFSFVRGCGSEPCKSSGTIEGSFAASAF